MNFRVWIPIRSYNSSQLKWSWIRFDMVKKLETWQWHNLSIDCVWATYLKIHLRTNEFFLYYFTYAFRLIYMARDSFTFPLLTFYFEISSRVHFIRGCCSSFPTPSQIVVLYDVNRKLVYNTIFLLFLILMI